MKRSTAMTIVGSITLVCVTVLAFDGNRAAAGLLALCGFLMLLLIGSTTAP